MANVGIRRNITCFQGSAHDIGGGSISSRTRGTFRLGRGERTVLWQYLVGKPKLSHSARLLLLLEQESGLDEKKGTTHCV